MESEPVDMAQTVPSIDEDEIIQYVLREGPVSSVAVAEEFDLPLQDAADLLLQLERDRNIRSEKSDGTVYWLGEKSSPDVDDVRMLSQESVEYITTGKTGGIPEGYRLQQLLEEIECGRLDAPIREVAGDGDLELLHRLFDEGFEDEWSRTELEELSVDEVVEEIMDLQQRVQSSIDALYRTSSLPTGDEIRVVRERLGVSQSEVAEKTAVNQSQLSNYENSDKGVSEERLQSVVEFYRERCEEEEPVFQSTIISEVSE